MHLAKDIRVSSLALAGGARAKRSETRFGAKNNRPSAILSAWKIIRISGVEKPPAPGYKLLRA